MWSVRRELCISHSREKVTFRERPSYKQKQKYDVRAELKTARM